MYSIIAETKNVESVPFSSSMARKTLCSTSSGDIKGAGSPIRRPCKPEPKRERLFEVDASMALPLLPSLLRVLHDEVNALVRIPKHHVEVLMQDQF